MADTTSATPPKSGGIAHQPWWVYAAGAGALLLGYWYFSRNSSSASSGTGTTSTTSNVAPSGLSGAQLLTWIADQQQSAAVSQPVAKPKHVSARTRHAENVGTIAKRYHLSRATLLKKNPELRAYGKRKKVPAGTYIAA